MLPAPTLADVKAHKRRLGSPLCAILIAPLFSKTAKEGLVPRFGYLNDRSGNAIHFYCAGYGG